METAAATAPLPLERRPEHPERTTSGRARTGRPLPLRPRGGFGGYLHDLRVERGLTIRQLAAAAGVHHTYVSKLERGDRHAPDEAIVETLAAALGATPSQLDQLRWRAGLPPAAARQAEADPATAGGTAQPAGGGPHADPTLTLVAEVLAAGDLPPEARDRLRRAIAQAVQGTVAFGPSPAVNTPASGVTPPAPSTVPGWPPPSPFAAPPPVPQLPPAAPPDPRAAVLAGLLSGWQTLDEAAAELRVTAAYLWELVQAGHLRAWALPGANPSTAPAGVRVRREDLLALLQPLQPAASAVPLVPVVPAAPVVPAGSAAAAAAVAPNGAFGVHVR